MNDVTTLDICFHNIESTYDDKSICAKAGQVVSLQPTNPLMQPLTQITIEGNGIGKIDIQLTCLYTENAGYFIIYTRSRSVHNTIVSPSILADIMCTARLDITVIITD